MRSEKPDPNRGGSGRAISEAERLTLEQQRAALQDQITETERNLASREQWAAVRAQMDE
ncbi:MAG TPA: hypothetical protein VK464_20045 [Symbiobacteriaceae bacterium]|jgi:hypothetical protein|nr:hypothetical protein [Symbiobacteriaceae bacterium]